MDTVKNIGANKMEKNQFMSNFINALLPNTSLH